MASLSNYTYLPLLSDTCMLISKCIQYMLTTQPSPLNHSKCFAHCISSNFNFVVMMEFQLHNLLCSLVSCFVYMYLQRDMSIYSVSNLSHAKAFFILWVIVLYRFIYFVMHSASDETLNVVSVNLT